MGIASRFIQNCETLYPHVWRVPEDSDLMVALKEALDAFCVQFPDTVLWEANSTVGCEKASWNFRFQILKSDPLT